MKLFIRKLWHLIPTKLPQGMTAFESWAEDIILTYDLPNNDSLRFALASAVIHSAHTAAYKPKAYFGQVMMKGAANEIAGAVMRDLKQKQQAAATASQEKTVANGQDTTQTS